MEVIFESEAFLYSKMKPDITYSNRSIEVRTPKYTIIYGESEQDYFTDEWCFVVWKNGVEKARYTNSELLSESFGERPVDLFLAGMVKYFCK
jgi:hypothetical protein